MYIIRTADKKIGPLMLIYQEIAAKISIFMYRMHVTNMFVLSEPPSAARSRATSALSQRQRGTMGFLADRKRGPGVPARVRLPHSGHGSVALNYYDGVKHTE